MFGPGTKNLKIQYFLTDSAYSQTVKNTENLSNGGGGKRIKRRNGEVGGIEGREERLEGREERIAGREE